MTEQPGPTPPSPADEPSSPAWGEAPPAPPAYGAPPAPPAYGALPAPPAYGVPVAYQAPTGTQTHQGGLWAMILGIVGLVSGVLALPTSGITALGMVCSPVALGLGLWSRKEIQQRPDLYSNGGQATAGWIMGFIGVVLGLLALLLVLAIVALFIWVFATASGDF